MATAPQALTIVHRVSYSTGLCPELISDDAVQYYGRYQPIGCRDTFTHSLLSSKALGAYESNCLSLLLPRKIQGPEERTEVLVVSRDDRILPIYSRLYDLLPSLPTILDLMISGLIWTSDRQILTTYQTRASLIITTLLHCEIPAIAMGISIVVFYPINNAKSHSLTVKDSPRLRR